LRSAAGLGLLLLLGLCGAACSSKSDSRPAPQALAELEQRISEVLEQTNTLGDGVALASCDDVFWVN
jgi:hypothetical protein